MLFTLALLERSPIFRAIPTGILILRISDKHRFRLDDDLGHAELLQQLLVELRRQNALQGFLKRSRMS